MVRSASLSLVVSLAMSPAIGGCAARQMPPEVDGPVAASALAIGTDIASVRRGREYFVTSCVRCHEPVMPATVSMEAWDRILPRMIRAARLDRAAHADIRAYIAAARDAAERAPAAAP